MAEYGLRNLFYMILFGVAVFFGMATFMSDGYTTYSKQSPDLNSTMNQTAINIITSTAGGFENTFKNQPTFGIAPFDFMITLGTVVVSIILAILSLPFTIVSIIMSLFGIINAPTWVVATLGLGLSIFVVFEGVYLYTKAKT